MKYNKKSEGTKTTNFMGEPAYTLHPKERLVNLTATCLFAEPKYYGNMDKEIMALADSVGEADPEFLLKLSMYIRNELYLRTISTVLFVRAANLQTVKGTGLIRKYAPHILKRADELTEAIAIQLGMFGKPIPNCLKKGVAEAFHNFDAYQFAKYNRGNEVKLKDVVRITHPKPRTEEESLLFKQIVNDNLPTPETWEVVISTNGSTREAWNSVIPKMGYMAKLRNIRNFVKVGANIDAVIQHLTNEKAILNSRQLPHRYLSAYEAVEKYGGESLSDEGVFESEVHSVEAKQTAIERLKEAIEYAMKKSADMNIPKISGKTVIVCDNSGSARGDYGGESKLSSSSIRSMADMGNLMGLLTWYSCSDTVFAVFGDRLTFIRPDRDLGMLKNFKAVDVAGQQVGQATEQGVFTMIRKMIDERIIADRIIVCSDLQIGDGKGREYGLSHSDTSINTVPKLMKEYREKVNPNIIYYSMCFSGHGNDVIVGDNKVLVTGWSDRVFQFIKAHEEDASTQVDYISSLSIQ